MKAKIPLLAAVTSLALLAGAQGQGTFQNLGFESGTFIPVPGDPYGRVQFASAMPGWVGYTGANQETLLLYNNYFLGTAGIGRHDSSSGYGPPLQGSFSLLLQAGSNPNGGSLDYVPAIIAQSGMVPLGSLTLRLLTDYSILPDTVRVSFSGNEIAMFPIGSSPNFNTYAGDISSFAGQTGELRIAALPGVPLSSPNTWFYLDGIHFSNQPVPEPSAMSLLAIGALLLGWRGANKKRAFPSKRTIPCKSTSHEE